MPKPVITIRIVGPQPSRWEIARDIGIGALVWLLAYWLTGGFRDA